MDEINRPDICAAKPGIESRIVQARMSDIEIKAALAAKLSPRGGSQDAFDDPAPNARPRFEQESEKVGGLLPAKDTPIPRVVDYGLGPAIEMAEVGQTNPIDSSGMAAYPPTPDEPGYVQQQGRVVRQESSVSEWCCGRLRPEAPTTPGCSRSAASLTAASWPHT